MALQNPQKSKQKNPNQNKMELEKFEFELNSSDLEAKISAMRTLGVPYEEGYESQARTDMEAQAQGIVESLKKDNIEVAADREIVALIAYLQRLGTDIKMKEQTASNE